MTQQQQQDADINSGRSWAEPAVGPALPPGAIADTADDNPSAGWDGPSSPSRAALLNPPPTFQSSPSTSSNGSRRTRPPVLTPGAGADAPDEPAPNSPPRRSHSPAGGAPQPPQTPQNPHRPPPPSFPPHAMVENGPRSPPFRLRPQAMASDAAEIAAELGINPQALASSSSAPNAEDESSPSRICDWSVGNLRNVRPTSTESLATSSPKTPGKLLPDDGNDEDDSAKVHSSRSFKVGSWAVSRLASNNVKSPEDRKISVDGDQIIAHVLSEVRSSETVDRNTRGRAGAQRSPSSNLGGAAGRSVTSLGSITSDLVPAPDDATPPRLEDSWLGFLTTAKNSIKYFVATDSNFTIFTEEGGAMTLPVIRFRSPFAVGMDRLRVLLAMWSVAIVPVTYAFRDRYNKFVDLPLLVALGIIADVLFLISVVLLVFTSVGKASVGHETVNFRAILRNRFTSWRFWCDAFSCAPLFLGLFVNLEELRLVTLLRIHWVFHTPPSHFETFFWSRMQVARMFMWILICTHLAACLWYAVASANDTVLKHLTPIRVLSDSSHYLTALKLGVLMLTGKPVPAYSDDELIVIVITSTLGGIFFAIIYGNTSMLLRRMNMNMSKHHKYIALIQSTIKNLNISAELQDRITRYHHFLALHHNASGYRFLMQGLSVNLFVELKAHLFKKFFAKAPFFFSAPAAFKRDLLHVMVEVSFSPGDIIIRYGDLGNEMYFVLKGKVEVLNPSNIPIGRMGENQYFGEIALLISTPRLVTIRAVTYCLFAMIQREKFEPIIEEYPEQKLAMIESMKNYHQLNAGQQEQNDSDPGEGVSESADDDESQGAGKEAHATPSDGSSSAWKLRRKSTTSEVPRRRKSTASESVESNASGTTQSTTRRMSWLASKVGVTFGRKDDDEEDIFKVGDDAELPCFDQSPESPTSVRRRVRRARISTDPTNTLTKEISQEDLATSRRPRRSVPSILCHVDETDEARAEGVHNSSFVEARLAEVREKFKVSSTAALQVASARVQRSRLSSWNEDNVGPAAADATGRRKSVGTVLHTDLASRRKSVGTILHTSDGGLAAPSLPSGDNTANLGLLSGVLDRLENLHLDAVRGLGEAEERIATRADERISQRFEQHLGRPIDSLQARLQAVQAAVAQLENIPGPPKPRR